MRGRDKPKMALKEKDMTTYYIKERIRFATWVLQRVEPTEMTQYKSLYDSILH